MSFAFAIDFWSEVVAPLELFSLLIKTILCYGLPSQSRSGRKFETMSFASATDFNESETLVTTAVLCKT